MKVTNQDLGIFAVINGEPGIFLPQATYVRVLHLAPFAADLDATAVSIELNGEVALSDFKYGDSTDYLTLDAGDYMVDIFPAGSDAAAISGEATFVPGQFYTVIAIGDGVNQPLELKVLLDDMRSPKPGSVKIRIGHLAPFAAQLDGTTADIRLQDGTPVMTGIKFGTITETYLELPAGAYDLKITSPGGDVTLIDPPTMMLADGATVDIFATGEGANQPLKTFTSVDGDSGNMVANIEEMVNKLMMPLIFR